MKTKSYEEGSLIDFANKGLSRIKKLSGSALVSEKLMGLNILLFVLTLSIHIFFEMNPNTNILSFVGLFGFALASIFSLIGSLLYAPILELMMNFSQDKVNSLKTSIILLMINVPIALAGEVYLEKLVAVSFVIFALQLFLTPFILINYSEGKINDVKINTKDIWVILGRIADICGILSFILSIIVGSRFFG